MNKMIHHLLVVLAVALCPCNPASAETAVEVTGELKTWHKLSLTFDGPETSETDDFNPFLNYRLDVRFTHPATGKNYLVPGYFAADGDAANTSADSGNQWRVNFSPDEPGTWTWQASFRKNRWVAILTRRDAGAPGGFMDGQTGSFDIGPTDKRYPDFRARGRLNYVHERYLRFAAAGEYFIKAGADAPENLLAYADFDGTFHDDGHKDELVKTWAPHVADWKPGDPTWQDAKGKGLIGALNYLASKGMNAISFLTLNIQGDDENVFPYIDYDTRDRMDVSKLDQWEIVFEHGQSLGLFLHFKTQEVENQGLLDGGGLGVQRKLYYRELVARFGHHLALNWNMGEENGDWAPDLPTPSQETAERLAMANWFWHNDPYNHHVVIHNGQDFKDLFGPDSYYTGASVQTHRPDFGHVHNAVKRLRGWPVVNGRPWAIAVDEPGDAEHALLPDAKDPDHDNARMNGLWGALTAGAWGTEWYFGYAHEHSDLTAQDWRTRELFWDQARHALEFFAMIDVPFHLAQSADELVSADGLVTGKDAYVLARPGEFYIVFAKAGGRELSLRLAQDESTYEVTWYNPRNGGELSSGSVARLETGAPGEGYNPQTWMKLGLPPDSPEKDWVILVNRDR
jgi:hypothetical protein